MEQKIFNLIDDFLNNFSYEDNILLENLNNFAKKMQKILNLTTNLQIFWKNSQSLFIEASTDIESNNICFNLCRKKIFERYKLNSRDENFCQTLSNIKEKLATRQTDEFDAALVWTIENKFDYLSKLGNWSDYPYSLVITILHELWHHKQKQLSKKDVFYEFCICYRKYCKQIIQPIELDANKFSYTILYNYFCHKKININYINILCSYLSDANATEISNSIIQNFKQTQPNKFQQFKPYEQTIKNNIEDCITHIKCLIN